MANKIPPLMKLRPYRMHKTLVVSIYGPTGIGKTTCIFNALETIRKHYPTLDYYSKVAGFSKWWDGYDNQPIVWIDDPVRLDVTRDKESIQQLKTTLSTGPAQVEITGRTLQFDAHLVIITSNATPSSIASSCGESCVGPILRRLVDIGGFRMVTLDDCLCLPERIFKLCKMKFDARLNMNIDVDLLLDTLPEYCKEDLKF